MKQLFTLFTALLIFTSTGFSIAGFGLHLDQGFYSVAETTTDLIYDGDNVGSIIHHGFTNGYGIGGYVYVDAIPMVDIDLEAVMHLAPYEFSLNQNLGSGISNQQFSWADFAMYATLQKKLFKLSIPLLAKAKLSAGAGLNTHSAIPMISQDMLASVMGGADKLEGGTLDTDELITYLKDNKVSSTGFHIQTGVQFKLLMLDSFLYYRHVFAKDVIPDASTFGSLNLRVGMGF